MYSLQPEKKNNPLVRFLAAVGVAALVLFACGVLGALPALTTIGSFAAPPTTHQVAYKITTDRDWGSCYGFDVTYEMPSGTAQRSVSLCDGQTTGVVDQRSGARGDFVYLSVQNDKQLARIGCEIYIDGKLVYQTHSEGQYVIASCSGSIP